MSHHALEASAQAAALVRGELARRARGPVTCEQYQIPIFEREVLLHGGEEVKPSAVTDVIEVFGDSAVPWLAETDGFRSALLFADPGSGRLSSEGAWQGRQARQQARASPR